MLRAPEYRPDSVNHGHAKALHVIITSLLDTDLYKFTMMQVVLHQFPGAQVEYRFKCRNPGINLAPYVDDRAARGAERLSLPAAPEELARLVPAQDLPRLLAACLRA